MDFQLPIDAWVENIVNYILDNFQPLLDGIAAVVDGFGATIDGALLALPIWLAVALLTAFSGWRVSVRFGIFTLVSLLLIVSMDLWDATISTLGLVLSSTLLSLILGIPLGVWMARSKVVESISKTTLDFMQTMPAFVYLIPAVMFFGLGSVVLQGIQRLDIGLGFKSGLSVVLLAIILDRITQSFGAKAAAPAKSRWAMPTFLHRLMPMPVRSNPTH